MSYGREIFEIIYQLFQVFKMLPKYTCCIGKQTNMSNIQHLNKNNFKTTLFKIFLFCNTCVALKQTNINVSQFTLKSLYNNN